MEIRTGCLHDPRVMALIEEHLQDMRRISPPESKHATGVESLAEPDITFWTVWDCEGNELMGCGALKELDPEHGETKSIRTASAHLRKGVALHLVKHIMAEAKRRRYRRLSLETGSQAAFEPARQLYARLGFRYCGPFADYVEDPNSVFMAVDL